MKFRYVGHACVGIEAENFILLLDPWFGYPFNLDEMSPYPPYGKPEDPFLKGVNAIHISHVHGDHLCPKSLAFFPMNIPIYIGAYAETSFQERLRLLGRSSVNLIPDQAGITVGPFRLFSFRPLKNDTSFDSILVLDYQGRHFLFNNDCVLSEAQYQEIKNQFGSFEGGFLGYTYVSPYPTCYEFTCLDGEQIAKERKEEAVVHVEKLIGIFNFKWVVPYASGMRFFNPDMLIHNRSLVDPISLVNRLGLPVYILEPGEIWSPGETPKAEFGYSASDIENWLMVTKQNRSSPEKQPLLEPNKYHLFFRRYFLTVSKSWKETMSVQLEVIGSDRTFICNFDSETGIFNLGKHIGPDLVLSMPSYAVNSILISGGIMRKLFYSYLFQATVFRYCGHQSRAETW